MHTAPAPSTTARHAPGTTRGDHTDPRLRWTHTGDDGVPVPHHRRDGILPAIAAALSVRGETLTCTGSKGDRPPTLHPLVQDYLDTLTTEHRERHTGRCPETLLLSRYLTATEAARAAKRSRKSAKGRGRSGHPAGAPAQPKPLTRTEARRALKHGKITARHIREDGDPLHGRYAAPCRSCTALLTHFGVTAIDPAQEEPR